MKRTYRWLGLLAMIALVLASSNQRLEASWPYRHCHPHHFYGGFQRPVYSSSFHTSFHYSYRFPAYSSYSYQGWPYRAYVAPRMNCYYNQPVFYPTTCFRPYYVQPVYYSAPVYHTYYYSAPICPSPVYYSAPCYTAPIGSCSTPSLPLGQYVVNANATGSRPLNAGSATNFLDRGIPLASGQATSKSVASDISNSTSKEPLGKLVSSPLDDQNNSPARPAFQRQDAWLDTALELIDEMVREGDAKSAASACWQLESVREQLPSSFHLRSALLSLHLNANVDDIVKQLQAAFVAGSSFDVTEIPMESLRVYLAHLKTPNLDSHLDRIAMLAEKNPLDGKALLILAALSQLDQQPERAKTFASAAQPLLPPDLQKLAAFLGR